MSLDEDKNVLGGMIIPGAVNYKQVEFSGEGEVLDPVALWVPYVISLHYLVFLLRLSMIKINFIFFQFY